MPSAEALTEAGDGLKVHLLCIGIGVGMINGPVISAKVAMLIAGCSHADTRKHRD